MLLLPKPSHLVAGEWNKLFKIYNTNPNLKISTKDSNLSANSTPLIYFFPIHSFSFLLIYSLVVLLNLPSLPSLSFPSCIQYFAFSHVPPHFFFYILHKKKNLCHNTYNLFHMLILILTFLSLRRNAYMMEWYRMIIR